MGNSLGVFSHSITSALRYMADLHGWKEKEVLRTHWFLDQVNKRFDLMSRRSPTMPLTLLNEAKHAEAVNSF